MKGEDGISNEDKSRDEAWGGRRRIEDKTGGKHEKGYREKGDVSQ